MSYETATIEELANLLGNFDPSGPKIAVLMGAGMSVSAGIPTANEIMKYIENVWPNVVKRARKKSYPEYMKCLFPRDREILIRNYINNSKVNLAHLILGALVKRGYIDRILTTNFDPLAIKSLALNNVFPAVYDFAATSEFIPAKVVNPSILYLHGQSNGFILLNTAKELNDLSKKLGRIFEETNRNRRWIIIGYSGENDPVFEKLADIDEYDSGLYWIGYKNYKPASHVQDYILNKKGARYIKGYDADEFFIVLAKELGIPEPRIIETPFTHLGECVETLSDCSKSHGTPDVFEKAKRDITRAIKIFESNPIMDKLDLVQKTRKIVLFKKYDEIDEMYEVVKSSNIREAKENIATALHNWGVSLKKSGKTEEYDGKFAKVKEKFREVLDIDPHNTNDYGDEFIRPREKISIDPNAIDKLLNEAGLETAANIFGTLKQDIQIVANKVYQKNLLNSYLHRTYVRKKDFAKIKSRFERDTTLNIIKAILEKRDLNLYYKKSHQFVPTIVGYDAHILGVDFDSPAMLHVQVSYAKEENQLQPIELLITKYLRPINMCGFLIDEKIHAEDHFSKTAEDTLKNEEYRVKVIEDNNNFYISFPCINDAVSKLSKLTQF